jgi:hypothetical protein
MALKFNDWSDQHFGSIILLISSGAAGAFVVVRQSTTELRARPA